MQDQANYPEVSVVILNYNGHKYLQQFLLSVLRTDYPNLRIIVADNASTDDSVAFLETKYKKEIEIIQLPTNFGFAEGYNQALKQIDTDYFALLNSDVEVQEHWLKPMVDLLESDKTIGVVQPKILSYVKKDFFEYAGAAGGWIDSLGYPFCKGRVFNTVEIDNCQYDKSTEIFWATGAAMLIKRDLFTGIGGFDGSYFAHMEEIDLCWRIKRAGYKIFSEPSGIVYHVGGGTMDYDNPKKAYFNFRNSLYTIYKNEPFSKRIWLIPVRLVLDGIAGGLFLTEGKFKHIFAIIRAHFAFYAKIPALIRTRRDFNRKIDTLRIGKPTTGGRLQGSVVWNYYLKKKTTFRELVNGDISK